MRSRSSFTVPIKFVTLSDPIIAGEPLRETNRLTHYTGTSDYGWNDFNMDSTNSQTKEEKHTPIFGSPTNSDVE